MDEKFLEAADALTRSLTERAIEKCREKSPRPDDFDGSCNCGEPIPEARVRLGYYLCVECQSQIELRQRSRR